MAKRAAFIIGILLFCLGSAFSYAQTGSGFGQTIQIYTHFQSFTGRPIWLLMIRDIDHNENLPYLFEVHQGENFWIAYTYSRNYLISASNLQFSPYKSNPYSARRVSNFCHLESNGRIIHGQSMYITINGDLTPNTNRYSCNVSVYPDNNFTIVTPDKTTN